MESHTTAAESVQAEDPWHDTEHQPQHQPEPSQESAGTWEDLELEGGNAGASKPAEIPATVEEPTTPTAATTTTTSAPAPVAAPAVEDREGPVIPEVAALHSMFPDFDEGVLASVFHSCGNNQERAIDMLLGMTDPDYVPHVQPQAPVMSQTDLDEQLARRLQLESDEQAHGDWQAQLNAQSRQRGPPGVPYDPNYPHGQPQPPQGRQGGTGDTVAEFQEQFNKVAEAGKKTFTNLFTKVKSKINELDQQRQGNQNQGPPQPTWGQTGQVPEQFYDPNLPSPLPQQGSRSSYITRPQPQRTTRPVPDNSATTAHPLPPRAVSPATRSSGDTPRPPATGSGMSGPPTGVDPGKLGLLPKRPVSLLATPAAGEAHTQGRSGDDDEELEYAENPFDDH